MRDGEQTVVVVAVAGIVVVVAGIVVVEAGIVVVEIVEGVAF